MRFMREEMEVSQVGAEVFSLKILQNAFRMVFPTRQEISTVSQIGFAFQRICPPTFIQT